MLCGRFVVALRKPSMLKLRVTHHALLGIVMNDWNRGIKFIGRLRSSPRALLLGSLILLAAVVAIFSVRAFWPGEEGELTRAAEAWDSGDYETAAEEYERFLQRNSDDAQSQEARFQLANVYYLNMQRYDEARAHYQTLLNEDPSYSKADTARERLGDVLAELGRSYEAIAEYESLDPQDEARRRRIRLRIADLYFDQKNYSQALTEYAKVTESANYDDLSERAYLREATIYHLARNEYRQALPIYEKLASETDDADMRRRAVYGIVDCYAGLFQFEDAIRTLREIKDEADQSYVKRRIAELEQQRRETAQAQSEMKQ